MPTARLKRIKNLIGAVKKMDAQNALYGSYLTDKYTKLSDIDLAVYYNGTKKERFKFRMALSGRVGDKFDVHTFQDLPLYIQAGIVRSNKMVYEKDRKMTYMALIKSLREYEGFKRCFELYTGHIKGAKID